MMFVNCNCCCGYRTCPSCGGSGVIPYVRPWAIRPVCPTPWPVVPYRPTPPRPILVHPAEPVFFGDARLDAMRARA